MLVELLLGHHLLHLLEHPLLDEPLGVVWVSIKTCYRSKLVARRSPCAVLVEESPQQNLDPAVQPSCKADRKPGGEEVGDGVDLGLGGDVGGSSLDHGHVAGGVGDAGQDGDRGGPRPDHGHLLANDGLSVLLRPLLGVDDWTWEPLLPWELGLVGGLVGVVASATEQDVAAEPCS